VAFDWLGPGARRDQSGRRACRRPRADILNR
jgi:hypothetical protein